MTFEMCAVCLSAVLKMRNIPAGIAAKMLNKGQTSNTLVAGTFIQQDFAISRPELMLTIDQ
jgi:hypothetical protein